jgi:hypothetical protein
MNDIERLSQWLNDNVEITDADEPVGDTAIRVMTLQAARIEHLVHVLKKLANDANFAAEPPEIAHPN